MKRIDPKRVVAFIGVMTAVALIVYLPRYNKEQRRIQESLQQERISQQQFDEKKQLEESNTAAQIRAKNAADERTKFLDQFLNTRFSKDKTKKIVGVAAASEDGQINRALTEALVSRFKNENVGLIDSMFKPAFFTKGYFSNVFTGSSEAIDELALTNFVDALLMAKQQVQYSTNNSLENVVSANMQLDVLALPLLTASRDRTWTFTASGAGFNPAAARLMAEQRIIKQISNDTKMSLATDQSNNQNQ